jgi:hypothetical protein
MCQVGPSARATLERREQYVSVFDLRSTVLPSGEQRQKQTLWMREHEPFLREYLLGTAFGVSSPLLRLTLSLLFHIAPTPAPYVVVSTVDEGVTREVARLKQSGLSAQAEHIRLRSAVAASCPHTPNAATSQVTRAPVSRPTLGAPDTSWKSGSVHANKSTLPPAGGRPGRGTHGRGEEVRGEL